MTKFDSPTSFSTSFLKKLIPLPLLSTPHLRKISTPTSNLTIRSLVHDSDLSASVKIGTNIYRRISEPLKTLIILCYATCMLRTIADTFIFKLLQEVQS